jgi:hypothetical protein
MCLLTKIFFRSSNFFPPATPPFSPSVYFHDTSQFFNLNHITSIATVEADIEPGFQAQLGYLCSSNNLVSIPLSSPFFDHFRVPSPPYPSRFRASSKRMIGFYPGATDSIFSLAMASTNFENPNLGPIVRLRTPNAFLVVMLRTNRHIRLFKTRELKAVEGGI